MEEHIFVALTVRGRFEVARPTTLDLNSTTRFLLDMLDVSTAVSDNLRT